MCLHGDGGKTGNWDGIDRSYSIEADLEQFDFLNMTASCMRIRRVIISILCFPFCRGLNPIDKNK